MLQSISSVFVVYRCKTLTGSPDPMHANGTDKPCTYNFHHRQHITSHVFTNKRLSIKLLYVIHRIFRKIILVTIGEKLHVNDAGHPFYVFGSPVAEYDVVDILHKFKLSINRCAPVCSLLLQKVFLIDHLIFYSNIFQRLIKLLDIVQYRIRTSRSL